ncbi:MAG: phosphotransferase [Desulfobacterota bacterium]|nr:phosphotransferase [Thermodesulfobacteriota bacterium]
MDLALLKKALQDPAAYPEPPGEIRFVETHISLVFLTGEFAYKVKKPVNFGFLDFTTLEKRRHYCGQEVVLNRRLAPSLYLGVVPITEKDGRISLEGEGHPVEFAVKMRQVPEDFLLDRWLKRGELHPPMMEAVAEILARFYSEAATDDRIQSFARPERVKQDTDENFEQTERYIGHTITQEVYSEIKEKTDQFFQTREGLFYQRIREGRIRDCHGDLRLEHIFWGPEIAIIDCIEFNERFRYTDVAADLAFLAMDLDYHGREDLSGHLIRSYTMRSGDTGLAALLDFYKCYRAYVRGKVESFRLDDPHLPEGEREGVRNRAEKYFALAHRYSQRF